MLRGARQLPSGIGKARLAGKYVWRFPCQASARGDQLPENEEGRKGQPVEGRCANHFDLAFTESEFLLDFGQAYDRTEPWIHTRIIMTPRSAKIFARMMQEMVQKFEQSTATIPGGQG